MKTIIAQVPLLFTLVTKLMAMLFLSWRMETEWQCLYTSRPRSHHCHHGKDGNRYSKLEDSVKDLNISTSSVVCSCLSVAVDNR